MEQEDLGERLRARMMLQTGHQLKCFLGPGGSETEQASVAGFSAQSVICSLKIAERVMLPLLSGQAMMKVTENVPGIVILSEAKNLSFFSGVKSKRDSSLRSE